MKNWIKRLAVSLGIVTLLFVAVPQIAPNIPFVQSIVHQVSADATNKYWVGGTGNWSDATNHWADSSGGAPGVGNLPSSTKNAWFDANSFTGAGQTVTVDAAVYCLNMDWTNVTNSPALNVNNFIISIYGNATLYGMTVTQNGGGFAFSGSGKTFTTNNINTPIPLIFSPGSSTALVGNYWNIPYGMILYGSLTTNGYYVGTQAITDAAQNQSSSLICGASTIYVVSTFTLSGAGVKTVTLGSANITCAGWTLTASGVIAPNTSTINCSGNFAGGGLTTYNIVNLTGATSTITGNNTFSTLGLTRAGVQTISFTDGTTQTVTSLVRDAGVTVKTLQGTGAGTWNITKSGTGYVSVDYFSITKSVALGAVNIWYAGTHSTNGGGNTGWFFIAPDVPTLTVQAATLIHAEDATGNGTITNLGAGNASSTSKGVDWGIAPGVYTGSATTAGAFGLAAFTQLFTTLPANDTIYYRVKSQNAVGWGYSAETSFNTAPIGIPTNLAITPNGVLTWVTGLYASDTVVVRGTSEYPAAITDGTIIYSGPLLTYTDPNPNPDSQAYYYSAWGKSGVYYSLSPINTMNGATAVTMIAVFILLAIAVGSMVGAWVIKQGWLLMVGIILLMIEAVLAYTKSTAAWDTYYTLFFASFGIVFMCAVEWYFIARKPREIREQEPMFDTGMVTDDSWDKAKPKRRFSNSQINEIREKKAQDKFRRRR